MVLRLVGLALLALSALGCAHRTLAVVDADGRGLAGVDVHVQPRPDAAWRALGMTDGSGVVRLTAADEARLRLVSLGRVTTVLRAGDLDAHVPIELRPQPLLRPGLMARPARMACAAADDPVARRMWEEASIPHRGGWDTVGLAAYGSFHGGPVGFEDRIEPPRDSSRGAVLALGGSHAVEASIREHGYAWPYGPGARGILEGQDYGYWRYPRFDLFNAHHLTSGLFGELNRLVVLHRDAETVQVGFCSRDRSRPYVYGALTLEAGEMVHAIWRFSTPDPVEDAGGEATFQRNPNAPILTPAVSVYWRSRGLDEPYLQRRYHVIDEYLLEHQIYELRTTNYELRTTNYELRTTNCELRTTRGG